MLEPLGMRMGSLVGEAEGETQQYLVWGCFSSGIIEKERRQGEEDSIPVSCFDNL
jgi:hypothetical protein